MFTRQFRRFIRKIRQGCWPWYVFKAQDTAIRKLKALESGLEHSLRLARGRNAAERAMYEDLRRMINGELTLAEQENTRLCQEVEKKNNVIRGLNADIALLDERNRDSNLEDNNKDVFRMLNGELTLAEQENTRLRAALAAEPSNESIRQELTQAGRALSDKIRENETLHTENDKILVEQSKLRAAVDRGVQREFELHTQNTRLRQEVEKNQQPARAIQILLDNCDRQVKAAEKEALSFVADNHALRLKMQTLEADYATELDKLRAEIKKLQDDLQRTLDGTYVVVGEVEKLRDILQPIYQEERKAVKALERKWRETESLAAKNKWKKANTKFLSRFGDYAP